MALVILVSRMFMIPLATVVLDVKVPTTGICKNLAQVGENIHLLMEFLFLTWGRVPHHVEC